MPTHTPAANAYYYVSGFGFTGASVRTYVTSAEIDFSFTDIDGNPQTKVATFTNTTRFPSQFIDLTAFRIEPRESLTVNTVTYTLNRLTANKPFDLNFVVYGTVDLAYDADKIILESSINKYNVLMALCEGPIEGIDTIKSGDTEIYNADDFVTVPNFDIATTSGITYAESQANFKTTGDDATLIPEATKSRVSLFNDYKLPKTITGTTLEQQLTEAMYTYDTGSADMNRFFKGINKPYTITGGTLNHRTCYNAINLDLEPIIIDSDNTFDKYPEEVSIALDFPGGVIEYNSSGDPVSTTVDFGIQYYAGTDATSATWEDQEAASNISSGTTDAVGYIRVLEGDNGFIEAADADGDINYRSVRFRIKNRAGIRVHLTLLDIHESVRRIKIFRITDDAIGGNLAGGETYYTGLLESVNDKKISSCNVPKYTVRHNNTKVAYAGTALLGVRAVANSKLNGTFPTITTELYGHHVDYIPRCRPDENALNSMQVYTEDYGTASPSNTWSDAEYLPLDNSATGAWKTGYCTNPVWCLLDILTNTRFGLGNYIQKTDLDIESFFEAAKFCDTKLDNQLFGTATSAYIARYSLNMVLDMKLAAKQLIDAILKTFRGVMFWNDGQFTIKVDEAASVSQILNDSQIENIAYAYKAPLTLNNAVEVRYIDEAYDYEQYTIYLEDSVNINLSDGAIRKHATTLAGVTNRQQAMSLAKHELYSSININKTIQFTASIDMLSAEIWDVIKIHTSKFLNDATYNSFVSSISSGTPSGTSYSYDVLLKRVPIQFDSDASTYSFAIQSYSGGTISLSEGVALVGTATDTDTYAVTILSDSATLDSTVVEEDRFTIYGNEALYDSWRIVGISVNPNNNTLTINGINYVDTYYDSLDLYTTPHYFSVSKYESPLSGQRSFNFTAALNNYQAKIDSYVDNTLNAMRATVHLYFPDIPEDAIPEISKLIVTGRRAASASEEYGDERVLNSVDSPNTASILLEGLEPGLWKFKVRIIDQYSRQYVSDDISLSLELGSIPVDTGQDIASNTALQTGLLDITGTNFSSSFITSTYLELTWQSLPNIISFLQVAYTDTSTAAATNTIQYPIARNAANQVVIRQNLSELTNYYPEYTVKATYTDIYGYSYTSPAGTATGVSIANAAPTPPNVGMFSVSTDETRIYVDIDSTIYNQYLATERDFVGFLLTVQHEYPTSTWNSSSYNYRKGVVDMFSIMDGLGVTTLNVRVYVQAVDNFDQLSSSVLIGTDTVTTSDIVGRDELASEFLGDSISLNLLRNSSFEQGND